MNKKLYFELLLAIGVSVLAAFLTFRLSEAAAGAIINTSYVKQHFSERKCLLDVSSLRNTAAVTDLSSGSAPKLDSWSAAHPYSYFLISDDGTIIYSSDYGFTSGAARELSYYSFDDDMSSYRKYEITFSDGTYKVYLLSFYSSQLYNYMFAVCIALGVTVFIILFTTLVYRKVRYIDRLSHDIDILEGGNLEYEVQVKGSDELAQLASSLNAMRLTLMRQNEAEAEQRKTVLN